MSDELLVAEGGANEAGGLSQVERVVDTFIAPAKTFTDILRSTSWWLPLVLFVVFSAASAFVVDRQIGFERVAESNIQQNGSASQQLDQLPPDQRAARMKGIATFTKYITYASGLFFPLFGAFFALLNWAGINFVLGGKTTFGQNMAVSMYASLPRLFISVLNIVFVLAGVNTENYNSQNPIGTNLAYYMPDASAGLKVVLTSLDLFALWGLVLTVIGTAIIAKKTIGQAAAVVVGWWALFIIVIAGFSALTS